MNPKGIIAAIWAQYRIYFFIAFVGIAATWIAVKVNAYVNAQVEKKMLVARNAMLAAVQTSIQGEINGRLDELSHTLDANFENINKSLSDAKANIETQRAQLDSIGDVWLRVDAVKGSGSNTGDKSKGSSGPGNQSGDNGASYAKLPAAHVQFLKGEATRANEYAVRLIAAQQALVQYKGAFEKYQLYVKDALEKAKTANDAK